MSGSSATTTSLRIGELAERTGVSVRSLRYYEEQGLLASGRTPGGHRVYTQAAVDRVIRVQELYAAGLNSRTIDELLPCMRDTDGGPSTEATSWLTDTLRDRRACLDRTIRDLELARDTLDEVIGTVTAEGALPRRSD